MTKTQNIHVRLLFFFLMIFFIKQAASAKYSVLCKPNQNCQIGLQASYTSPTGKTTTACINTQDVIGCPTIQTQFNVIDQCIKDEFGQQCSDSVCIKREPLEHCISEIGQSQCPENVQGRVQEIICGDCKQANCKSKKCVTSSQITLEACFSQTECPLITFKTTFGRCTDNIDSYGDKCNCCALTSDNVRASICSNQVALFNSQEFKLLKKSEEPDDGNIDEDQEDEEDKNNWEYQLRKVWVILLWLIAIVWE